MKRILPSSRPKKRYLVYEIISEAPIKFENVKRTINSSLVNFLGVSSLSKINPIIIPLFDGKNGIIKINNNYLDEVKLALMLIKEINNKKVIFKNIYVSGILRKAKRFLKGGFSYATNQSKSGNGLR